MGLETRIKGQEKSALLLDAGMFMERMPLCSELDSKHGARQPVIVHGRIQDPLVAGAIFNAAGAAGTMTIAIGEKRIAQMRWADAHRCPPHIDWDSGGVDINEGGDLST